MTILIDLSWFIATFLFIVLLLVIGHWLMYTSNRMDHERMRYSDVMRQCYYCNLVFFDFKNKDLVRCPRCHSYLEKSTATRNKNMEG